MSEYVVPRQVRIDELLASGDAAARSGDWIGATREWIQAAKLGDVQAANLVTGVSAPRLLPAAEAGDVDALAVLAGVLMDYFDESALPRAVRYASQAAGQGHAKALRTLGFMHVRGLGVQQDFARAVALWRESCERGDGYAAFNLAGLHICGDVPLSSGQECLELLTLAVERGVVEAAAALGDQLAAVDRDEEALGWIVWAAQRGYVQAMFAAGCWYRDGIGTAADPVEALRWFFTMFDHGSADGVHEVMALAKSGVSYEQIREAARRAGRPGDAQVTIQALEARQAG